MVAAHLTIMLCHLKGDLQSVLRMTCHLCLRDRHLRDLLEDFTYEITKVPFNGNNSPSMMAEN